MKEERADLRQILVVSVPIVLAPVLFELYWIGVYTVLAHPFTVKPLSGAWIYIGMLGTLATTVILGWRRGLRLAPAATGLGLLIFPWLTLTTEIGGAGYPAWVFVFALLATVIEWEVRAPMGHGVGAFLEGTVGRYALTAGFLHLILGFGLQIYVRRLQFADPAYGVTGMVVGSLIYAVTGFILFATGAVPVIAWCRERLVTPAVVTVGWFSWGLSGIFTSGLRFPLGEFTGIRWMHPAPHPDYMLQSTVLLVGVLSVTGLELLLKRIPGSRILSAITS
jgi:hypothetical protein